ncbi:MAG: MFS transporter [Hyphomicrobiaceae bacterium]
MAQFISSDVRDTWRAHAPALLVGTGHGATHWLLAAFYVVLPFLSQELHLSYAQTGALVSLFHGSSLVANIGSGAIVDIAGRRVLVQALSLIAGTLAMIAVGYSTGIVGLVVPVVFIGLTNNLWHPAAISFLSRSFPQSRGFALSIHTLGATFGDMLAPVVVGALLTVMSWRDATVLSALPVLLVAGTLLVCLREAQPTASEHNGGGRARAYLFGVWRLIRDRAVMSLCVMAGFRSMTQNGLLVFIPLYLVGVLKVSPLLLGVAMMVLQIGGVLAGPLAGAWSDRAGRQPVALVCLTATSLTIAGFVFVTSLMAFLLLVFVLGFAVFSVRPVIHSWTMDLTPDDMAGTAVSVLFGIQSAFTLLVPILGGLIADQWGLHAVFYLLAGTSLVATAITYTLPDVRRQPA